MPGAFEELRSEVLGCTRCELSTTRTQVVFGSGPSDAAVMIVGEAPGAEEDRTGVPFVGRSGQLLERVVAEELGLARDDCFIANVVKCRPPENRDPRPVEVAACRPYLADQVRLVAPRVVLTVGNFAARLLLETRDGITRLRGRSYPFGDATLVPTLHPAAVLRGGAVAMASFREDIRLVGAVLDGAAA